MTRRRLLRVGLGSVGIIGLWTLAACAPPSPAPPPAAPTSVGPAPTTAPAPPAPATPPPAPTIRPAPTATTAPVAAPTAAPIAKTVKAVSGDLKVGVTGFPVGWDALFATSQALQLDKTLLDPLVFIVEDLSARPGLAKTWDTPDGGKTWNFHLVQTNWHDGKPFTSADVKAHYDRMLDPKTGSGGKAVFDIVEAIDAPDAGTVRFKLRAADAEFPILTGSYQGYIQPAHLDPAKFKTDPIIGTGPFKWDKIVPGESIRLVANESYFTADQPRVASLTYASFQDSQAMLNALAGGEIDVAGIGGSLASNVQSNPDLVITQSPSAAFVTIYLHGEQVPGNNPKIVRAFKLSLDRQGLLQAGARGFGVATADNPVVPGSPAWTDLGVPKRDIATARTLLQEAGYKGEELELVHGDTVSDLAQATQSMMTEAGFNVKLTAMPTQILFSQQWLKLNFSIDGWSPRPTLDAQYRVAFTCSATWNEGHWCDPKFDAMLDEARATVDAAKRKTLQAEIQKYAAENSTSAIPYHYSNVSAYRKRVQNFKEHSMGVATDFRAVGLSGT